jgi:hypothetical protein
MQKTDISARSRRRTVAVLAACSVATLLALGGCQEPAPTYNDGYTGAGAGTGSGAVPGAGGVSGVGGATAAGGTNATACPGTQQQCAGVCTDTSNNALNCGICGTVCQSGALCTAGACQCQGGLTSCGATCVDVMSNGANCGTCNTACGAGLVCSLGTCSATCATGLTQCGQSCINPMSDVANCGTCGNACGAGQACSLGVCGCGGGQIDCGAGCIDILSNVSNCGVCGKACGTGEQCVSGACQCPSGMTCTPGSGGAGGGGGAAGAGGSGGTSGLEDGGYIDDGNWHGYAWSAIGGMGTIDPTDFGTIKDFPLCASGSIQKGNDNVAMVGWNLNQPKGMNPPLGTVTPTKDGITVAISKNTTGVELRMQIQMADGDVNANHRWCAVIPGDGGFIPFEAFNTQCWAGGMGTKYNGEEITAALVIVPGNPDAARTFDFCAEFGESDSTAPPPGTGCNLSGGTGDGTTTVPLNDFQTTTRTRDGHSYVIQNNPWGGTASLQTTTVTTGVTFQVTKQSDTGKPTTGAPFSFPSIYRGSNGAVASSNSNLPKLVSSLTDVPTGWKWSGNPSGEWNAAYDVWFSTNTSFSNPPSGGYLMVWYRDPPAAQPLGTVKGTGEQLAGKLWNVWVCDSSTNCSQNGKPVISYVPNDGSTINEMSYDLNDFIQNAVTKYKVIQNTWHLSAIMAGFEIWSGGLNLKSDNFCAVVP